jgi:tRNA threonylcarbamoyladenosine biosynthesis protein TsaB
MIGSWTMKILAVEFSSDVRTIAIVEAGDGTATALLSRVTEGSARRTLGLVSDALEAARCEREDIGIIAIGLGPGSYTGIRGAIALAQGWQLGRAIQLVGISSVECLAGQAADEKIFGPISVVVDAQRNEYYLACYEIEPGGWREVEALRLAAFAEIEQIQNSGQRLIGPGISQFFPKACDVYPDAATLGRMACARRGYVPGENLEPIYLREVSFTKAPPPRAKI